MGRSGEGESWVAGDRVKPRGEPAKLTDVTLIEAGAGQGEGWCPGRGAGDGGEAGQGGAAT